MNSTKTAAKKVAIVVEVPQVEPQTLISLYQGDERPKKLTKKQFSNYLAVALPYKDETHPKRLTKKFFESFSTEQLVAFTNWSKTSKKKSFQDTGELATLYVCSLVDYCYYVPE